MATMNTDTGRARRQRLDVAARREAILAAALRCYAEAPYAEVSVADVAREAHSSTALVFHYFGSKAALYGEVVTAAVAELSRTQQAAIEAIPEGAPRRDRVRASILIYLDHIAAHPRTWAAPLLGGEEPPEAVTVRHQARASYVEALRGLLRPAAWTRHDYALWGYFGFLDQACLRWVSQGCPNDQRDALADAALGALEGALGDWGS